MLFFAAIMCFNMSTRATNAQILSLFFKEAQTMRKMLSLLLALAMILAIMPAAFAEEGDLEPITLTAFIGDPGDQPADDNKIFKLIEEKFGVTFEFEYLAGDLDEKLGLMIAAEDYPDLFWAATAPT